MEVRKGICKVDYGTHKRGDIIEYFVNDERKFEITFEPEEFDPGFFFNFFKPLDMEGKDGYAEFEYALCNYIFTDAVLFPEEYNGVQHLIIQLVNNETIMITVSKEGRIRISYPDGQSYYNNFNFEEAYKEIVHKYRRER